MPSPKSLKLRLALINRFEQIVAGLDNREPEALEQAQDSLMGIAMGKDYAAHASLFRAMIRELNDMQGEIDAKGYRYVEYDGHEPPNA